MTELHRSLLRNMKRYRGFLGISQAELAARSGLSVGFIGEVEIGSKFPSPEKLEAIARVLGVRAYRLLMGPDDYAEALGPKGVYEISEKLKTRLADELDSFVREMDPDSPKPPPACRGENGRPLRGR